MKIQLALDLSTITAALKLLEEVHEYIDIAEVGSPLIACEGFHAIRAIKEHYPDLTVLADCKIVDGASFIGGMAYDAGADIVTVMAFANDYTILQHAITAHRYGKLAEVDMMEIENIKQRSQELLDMGIDIIGMHASAEALRPNEVHINRIKQMLSVVPSEKACIANSLTFETMEQILVFKPGIVVISGPILQAKDKVVAAKRVKAIFDKYR